ncbi:GntR family transcriptional regulator [Kibdelosporangium banguiense]|uniref:GntR family transcriptional regulator n=1 Tax=Kibdelosporangium banguiense TaxID=1365924 RepID=A0ABS4TE19_9PSEU|nr:GntR family transcriptional regulator [Kibdelosporangium banguiense]
MPAKRQVFDDIRSKIESGELAPNAQLSSERELVERYDVSRPTIREAVRLLREHGLVRAEHGRGVFVRPAASLVRLARNRLSRAARAEDKGAFMGDAATGGFTPDVSTRVRKEPADETSARLLEIEPGDEILVRDRVMRANGQAVQLAISRFSRSVTRGTLIEEADTGPGGVYARLEEAGHVLTHFDEVVTARMPSSREQSLLQLADGTPVIAVTRIAFAADRPVELNDMVLAADKYELHYRLPAE